MRLAAKNIAVSFTKSFHQHSKESFYQHLKVCDRHVMYDTVYFDGDAIDFFTKPIGHSCYSPVRAGYHKTRADTNMETFTLPPNHQFIVETIFLEENTGSGFVPLNTRGYMEMLLGSRCVVSYPTDIGYEEISALFIDSQQNFCVTLRGEIFDRDLSIEPVYRCRLGGLRYRDVQ